MKLQFQTPSLGAPRHLPPWCALVASKPPVRFQPRLKILPRPHKNYNQTNPAGALVSSKYLFPKPFS
jgi:hypothetical protein